MRNLELMNLYHNESNTNLHFGEYCYEKGRADERKAFKELFFERLKLEVAYLQNCGMGKKKCLEHLMKVLNGEYSTNSKEQLND